MSIVFEPRELTEEQLNIAKNGIIRSKGLIFIVKEDFKNNPQLKIVSDVLSMLIDTSEILISHIEFLNKEKN